MKFMAAYNQMLKAQHVYEQKLEGIINQAYSEGMRQDEIDYLLDILQNVVSTRQRSFTIDVKKSSNSGAPR